MINYKLKEEERTPEVVGELKLDADGLLNIKLNGIDVGFFGRNGELYLYNLNFEEQRILRNSGIQLTPYNRIVVNDFFGNELDS